MHILCREHNHLSFVKIKNTDVNQTESSTDKYDWFEYEGFTTNVNELENKSTRKTKEHVYVTGQKKTGNK